MGARPFLLAAHSLVRRRERWLGYSRSRDKMWHAAVFPRLMARDMWQNVLLKAQPLRLRFLFAGKQCGLR